MQSHCMTCLKHIESEWGSTSTPSNHHFWSNWAASTTSSKWVHMHRKATVNSINPSFQQTLSRSPKPNDSWYCSIIQFVLANSFPFCEATQHRFPPRSAPGFVWFQSFPWQGVSPVGCFLWCLFRNMDDAVISDLKRVVSHGLKIQSFKFD